jgi:hypothetical protein
MLENRHDRVYDYFDTFYDDFDTVYDDFDIVYDGFDTVLLAKLTLKVAREGGKVEERIERSNCIRPTYVCRVTEKTMWRLA